jgi:hypothetical protein
MARCALSTRASHPLNDRMRELNDDMRDEERKIERELRTMIPDLIRRGLAQEVTR